ncbi:MAG TPA: hypothetical protein VFM68_00205 [Candidatus Saccharimonadales bacterium]|nr:hypothetical protein [Candidatus Saccharimonadales bacterium]
MKRFLIITAVFAISIAGIAWFGASARAQQAEIMTEAHIERIRSNCVDAQSILFQLHASDAGLRVNRGQIYESISTKLMTPLNSRIVLNRLDSVNLVSIAANYENQLQEFRTLYQQYEESMSDTLDMDCTDEPVAFYDSIAETREKRQLTHDSTVTLHKTILEYGDEFEAFAEDFQADNS